MSNPLHIVVLAAGDGTRMKSRLPKVLHTVGGRPMIARVLETAARLHPERIHVVYNPAAGAVRAACADHDVDWVAQEPRLGTGHAVHQAVPGIPPEADVLVLYADIPLVPDVLLTALVESGAAPLRLLTMNLADPAGYGRVVRDNEGRVAAVVEEGDAGEAQRRIGEVNTGILAARAGDLQRWLGRLGSDNRQGEFYLTDIFAMAAGEGVAIAAIDAPDSRDLLGANDRAQIAALEDRHRQLEAARLMREGVRIADPGRVELRGDIRAGTDVSIDVNVVLEGQVSLGDGVTIGPGCVLRDCDLAAGTRVHAYSVLEGARTLGACDIGPFARIRPGSEFSEGSRVGNFVEVKNASLGAGSRAGHLSYLGDADIGAGVNIGAGTITCNYDGARKHRTVIEDGAFIGSDTQLVAPVRVGRGADIGAGSTITRDAPEGKLTLSRVRQVTVPGWKRPRKDGE